MIQKTIKEYKYEMTIYWSFDEHCYIGEAPELDNCSVKGKTQSETFINLQNAIMLWVKRATDAQMLVPQPLGRLGLKDDIYTIDARQYEFLNSRWQRTQE